MLAYIKDFLMNEKKILDLLSFRHIAVIASVIFIAVFFLHSTSRKIWTSDFELNNSERYGDIFIVFDSALALRTGGEPYLLLGPEMGRIAQEWRAAFCYPLTSAWMLIPATYFSVGVQKAFWAATLLVLLVGIMWGLVFLAKSSKLKIPEGWAFPLATLVTLLCFEPIQNNFLYLQINPLMMVFCVLTFCAYKSGHKNLAALSLGAAISIKLLPALFLAFFVLRREWRVTILAPVFAVLLALVPYLWLGNEVFSIYHTYIYDVMIPRMGNTYTTELFFTLHRTASWFDPTLLNDKTAKMICNILTLVVICGLDLLARKKVRRDLWAVCLYSNAILMLMPQSQMHYLILLLPGLFFCLLKALEIKKVLPWIVFAIGYGLYFPLMWVENTPIIFAGIVTLTALCGFFMLKEKSIAE